MSLQQTFNSSLAQIFRQGVPQKIAVALSGGVDSMCLTHLLSMAKQMSKSDVEIYPIHINHNLRRQSASEIPIVRHELTKLGLNSNFLTKELSFDELHDNDSFEELARLKRYSAIQELCQPLGIKHIVLGHHFDDQLETFTLRLLKNSGVFGLAGMSPISKAPIQAPERMNLIRPLLGVPKSEIIQYCLDNNVNWVEDHTNLEDVANRNIVRNWFKDHEEHRSDAMGNFSKVQIFTKSLENKVNQLSHAVKVVEPSQGCITVNISKQQLDLYSDLVISRMLFKLLYPISPSLNYHYSYNKLQAAAPKLRTDSQFTLLQLQWAVKKLEDGSVEINVARQNPTEPVSYQVTVPAKGQSEYFLFDNIYWIRFTNDSKDVKNYTVKTLTKDDRSQFEMLPEGFKFTDVKNRPVVVDNSSGKIVGFANELDFVECKVKENIY